MRLEDYLQKLETTPDDKLEEECGVYDNWPIFVDLEQDRISKLFSTLKYEFIEKDDRGTDQFRVDDNVTVIQVFKGTGAFAMVYGTPKGKESYISTVMLHPYQNMEKGFKPGHKRALANNIINIGNLFLTEKVDICMPMTSREVMRRDLAYYTK